MKHCVLLILLFLPAVAFTQPLWSLDKGQAIVNQQILDDVITRSISQFNILAGGENFLVEVGKVSPPNLGVTSVSGRIRGLESSFFLLCRSDQGATVAFFKTRDGNSYRLDHSLGEDRIRMVDPGEFGSCGGGLVPPGINKDEIFAPKSISKPAQKGANSRSEADDGSRHDILIGFTPRAETVMGGLDYMRAECQLAVDAANLVYENSLISSRLHLVHIMSTDYSESVAWDYVDHLDFLRIPNDGKMDDMLEMRNRVGADFVSVLIDGRNTMGDVPICGIAYVMTSEYIGPEFEGGALSVVSVQCATPNWSLAHEVGHNRGCVHDRDHSSSEGAYPYSYGHLFAWNGNTETGLRTVMAYDNSSQQYERVPYFSNPQVSVDGHPTGVMPGQAGEAHNALTHNNTKVVCANFRNERTFVKFSSNWASPDGTLDAPYSTLAAGFDGSAQGGHVVIQESKADFSGVLSVRRSLVSDATAGIVLGGAGKK